jgi:hypothetical protein
MVPEFTERALVREPQASGYLARRRIRIEMEDIVVVCLPVPGEKV